MEEWKEYKLKDIATVQTGPFGSQLHNNDYVTKGTPIVTVEHLGERRFTTQNLPMVSEEDRRRLNKYDLKAGDVVFSRVGSVDRCSYVTLEEDGWLFSGRCIRVRNSSKCIPLFLYYFFCIPSIKQYIRNIAVGATMPSINTKLMTEIPIRMPSIELQNQIASILSSLDDKIELNRRINDNLEQFKHNFLLFMQRIIMLFVCASICCVTVVERLCFAAKKAKKEEKRRIIARKQIGRKAQIFCTNKTAFAFAA